MTAKTIGVAVVGATVGYVAGVLTAPAKGAETRRRIEKKVGDKASNLVRNARLGMKTSKSKVEGAFAMGGDKVKGAFASGGETVKGVFASGERKVGNAISAFKRS
jgi:gas vesicle protein